MGGSDGDTNSLKVYLLIYNSVSIRFVLSCRAYDIST